jgi:hypothetical protein
MTIAICGLKFGPTVIDVNCWKKLSISDLGIKKKLRRLSSVGKRGREEWDKFDEYRILRD